MARSSKGKFVARGRRGRRVGARASKAGRTKAGHRRGRRIGNRASMFGGRSKFSFLGLDVVSGLIGGTGAVLTGYATNLIADKLPWEQAKTGPGKLGVRTAVTIVGGFAANKFAPKSVSIPLIGGMLFGWGIDVLQTFVLPHLPIPAMNGYEPLEQQLQAIEYAAPGSLAGLLRVDGSGMAGWASRPLSMSAA